MRVSTWKTRSHVDDWCSVRVQPLEEWVGAGMDPCVMEAFAIEPPTKSDLLGMLGTDPANKHRVQRWDAGPSDVEGCLCLSNPRPCSPSTNLRSKSIPVLTLLDALAEQGWASEAKKVVHSRESPTIWDSWNLPSARFYLQCLRAVEELMRKGAEPFPSRRPQAFYRSLLLDPSGASAQLSAAECEKRAVALEGQETPLESWPWPLPLSDNAHT